eukprot:13363537-Alexandrium_andersonii.AAC.1
MRLGPEVLRSRVVVRVHALLIGNGATRREARHRGLHGVLLVLQGQRETPRHGPGDDVRVGVI